MNKTALADIPALCDVARIAPEAYKRFRDRRSKRNMQPPTPPVMPGLPVRAEAPAAPAPVAPPISRPAEWGNRWHSLQSVLLQSPTAGMALAGSRMRPGVVVLPSASGSGATTILATVARLLSAKSESVAIVENSHDSLLPMHFGARMNGGGFTTIHFNQTRGAGPVHILTPPSQPVPVLIGNFDSDRNTTGDDWLLSDLERLNGSFDRLLIKSWAGMSGTAYKRYLAGRTCLVPIVPDVRSAMKMQTILNRMQERGSDGQLPYFVLNRFDANVALHTDMRDWLRQRLGSQLLPITIRRATEIDEALAEGMTVVDYAPNSSVAGDFRELTDWCSALSA